MNTNNVPILDIYNDGTVADATELSQIAAVLGVDNKGLEIYQRDTDTRQEWDGTQWIPVTNGGVPSCIELVGTAIATTVATEVNSAVEVATLSDGNIISTGFFNVALDPNTIGVAGTLIDPAEGATIDIYLVGFPATAVTGATTNPNTMYGFHFEVTKTNGSLVAVQVGAVSDTGYFDDEASGTAYNDLPTASAITANFVGLTTGDGFTPVAGASPRAFLQMDGTYLKESDSSVLTVSDAITEGWTPCPVDDAPNHIYDGTAKTFPSGVTSVEHELSRVNMEHQNYNEMSYEGTTTDADASGASRWRHEYRPTEASAPVTTGIQGISVLANPPGDTPRVTATNRIFDQNDDENITSVSEKGYSWVSNIPGFEFEIDNIVGQAGEVVGILPTGRPGFIASESCVESTETLLPTTFTVTTGAVIGGGDIVFGGGGLVGGTAERAFPVTNIGKKHTLSFDHYFNGNPGQDTFFAYEIVQGGQVIKTGDYEANSATAVTETVDFYPTEDVTVRFIDTNQAGAAPSSDIRVTAVSIEATCIPFVGEEISNWIKEECYEEPQAPVQALFTGTDYADDNSATTSGVTSTVALTGPLTLAASVAGDGGLLPAGDAVRVTTTTTNVDGTIVLTFDSPTDVTLGVQRLNGNEIVNFITPIDSMVLGDAFNQAGVGPQAYSGNGNNRNEFTFLGATQIEWTHQGPATGFVLYDVNADLSPEPIEHTVRTNEDGSLLEVDRTANTLTPIASIPGTWTLCPETVDTFGTVVTAAAPLTTTNGKDILVGEQYVELPDGTTYSDKEVHPVTKRIAGIGFTNNNGPGLGARTAGVIEIEYPQTITVTHEGIGLSGNGDGFSGMGISTIPYTLDGNGFVDPGAVAAADIFSSTADRITATTPEKSYEVTLQPGKYYLGVFSGGNASAQNHNLTVDYVGFEKQGTFPSLPNLNIRQLEIDGELCNGDTFYNEDLGWLQSYIQADTPDDNNVWPWVRVGQVEDPNQPSFFGDVTQANAVGPQYINVGSFVPLVSGDYTIKHSAGNNTGTNAFSITTTPATQANPTVDVAYTTDADRLLAADSDKTYTDVTLTAGETYYFSVWSGGGSTSLWHFLEVTGVPGSATSNSAISELITVSAQNVFADLANAPADPNNVLIFINGQVFDTLANSGVAVDNVGEFALTPADIGFNVETTDRVVAQYVPA